MKVGWTSRDGWNGQDTVKLYNGDSVSCDSVYHGDLKKNYTLNGFE